MYNIYLLVNIFLFYEEKYNTNKYNTCLSHLFKYLVFKEMLRQVISAGTPALINYILLLSSFIFIGYILFIHRMKSKPINIIEDNKPKDT